MTTVLTYIIAFFSMIGIAVVIVFATEAISKKSSDAKEYKKKRIDNLEKINDKLDEIIRRKEPEEKGKVLIENPQLHLTALYFMQAVRKTQKVELTGELKELHEEMMVHYQRGTYIIPVREHAGTLVMKQKNGQVFQPVFTDIQEYKKFLSMQKEGEIQSAVLPAEKIPALLAPETAGVVVNPFGVNLQLQIRRGKPAGSKEA